MQSKVLKNFNMDMDVNKPLWQLTVGEFLSLQKSLELPDQHLKEKRELSDKKYVYGLSGIAKLFNCSRTTAYKYKSSGMLDGAVKQSGRIIIVDAEEALRLFDENKKNL